MAKSSFPARYDRDECSSSCHSGSGCWGLCLGFSILVWSGLMSHNILFVAFELLFRVQFFNVHHSYICWNLHKCLGRWLLPLLLMLLLLCCWFKCSRRWLLLCWLIKDIQHRLTHIYMHTHVCRELLAWTEAILLYSILFLLHYRHICSVTYFC